MSVKKEGNPIKIWLLIITILLVAIIAIQLFVKQSTDGEKIGVFGMKKDDPTPTPTPTPNSALAPAV